MPPPHLQLIAYIDQRVPIKDIFATGTECEQWGLEPVQRALVQHLDSSVAPHNPYYAQCFLRTYIETMERVNASVLDETYLLFCSDRVLRAKPLLPTEPDTVRYPAGGFHGQSFVLTRESPRIISGNNTTGMRTWEAALLLSNVIADKTITGLGPCTLELGAGTGLVSWAMAKNGHTVIASDGLEAVMLLWPQSMALNEISVRTEVLYWGQDEEPIPHVSLIVAADVTYDTRTLGSLCSTINTYFTKGNCTVAIIAATVRNENTIERWEQEISAWFGKLNWDVCYTLRDPFAEDTGCVWFPRGTPPIRIYRITVNKTA